ncbi:MAG: DsrE/DsrF/DrsH-like family protein [Bryobacteraceae bacterium]
MTETKPAAVRVEDMFARLATLEDEVSSLRSQLHQVRTQLPANQASLCLLSGDFERVLTTLMMAHMAVALEMEVSIFFAFWGVQAVKKSSRYRGKALLEKATTAMLKRNIRGLPSEKFNFGGLGPKVFARLMKQKGIATPADLMASSGEAQIRLLACSTSLEVFGIAADELLPGVACCGAANFLESASRSKIALVL